jgi:osmotically-inducible protein OsmY
MMKQLSIGICGAAIVLTTAAGAMAQSTTDKAKASTKAAAAKTEEVIDDSAITTSIKAKLLADKKTSAFDIGVETTNGVVTLSGKVTSSAERAEALKIAKRNKGVTRVVDKMTLEPKSK